MSKKEKLRFITPLVQEHTYPFGQKMPYELRIAVCIFSTIVLIGTLPFLAIGIINHLNWLVWVFLTTELLLIANGWYNYQRAMIERREGKEMSGQ